MEKPLTALGLVLAGVFLNAAALPLPDFVNPEHDFIVVPDSDITLSGCTSDYHRFISNGHMTADQQEMQAAHLDQLPVKQFRHELQTVFATQIARYSSRQFVIGGDTSGYDNVGPAMTAYFKQMKDQTGVTMLFIPSGEGGISPREDASCRPI